MKVLFPAQHDRMFISNRTWFEIISFALRLNSGQARLPTLARTRLQRCSSFGQGNSGQALAEVLFALAMSILLIMGMVVAMRSGLSNSQYSVHKIQSRFLAEEGIELARKARDNNGITSVRNGCCNINNNTIQNGTTFIRSINTNPSPCATIGLCRVTVTIEWTELNRDVNTVLTTILTNRND